MHGVRQGCPAGVVFSVDIRACFYKNIYNEIIAKPPVLPGYAGILPAFFKNLRANKQVARAPRGFAITSEIKTRNKYTITLRHLMAPRSQILQIYATCRNPVNSWIVFTFQIIYPFISHLHVAAGIVVQFFDLRAVDTHLVQRGTVIII